MASLTDKLLDAHSLSALLDILRSNKQCIVFTNGCFDLLHPGHIDYLTKAKNLGDVLFVAVNDDLSVKTLKGDSRPINPLSDRMKMLAALECVDFVISFSEDTPLKLIQKVSPNILVKGGDYNEDEIVGAEHVKENDGKVQIIEFLDGYSSTNLINRIKKI